MSKPNFSVRPNGIEEEFPLSDHKSRKSSISVMGKINPSDRATLLSGHAGIPAVREIDIKTSGEIGNIYLGVRCKPGISFWNFMTIPLAPFFQLVVLDSYLSLEQTLLMDKKYYALSGADATNVQRICD